MKNVTRKQAALLLRISASHMTEFDGAYADIAKQLGWNDGPCWRQNPAITIAYCAWEEARKRTAELFDVFDNNDLRAIDAYAAEILEDGTSWNPTADAFEQWSVK